LLQELCGLAFANESNPIISIHVLGAADGSKTLKTGKTGKGLSLPSLIYEESLPPLPSSSSLSSNGPYRKLYNAFESYVGHNYSAGYY
jgi:hypothetical protein